MKKIIAPVILCFIIATVLLFGIKAVDKHSTVQTATTPTAVPNLANPASVNCGKKGGNLVIKTMGNGGQFGLCEFEDNMSCEEWAMYRGDCPVGGIKTTGYDNIQQMYCAWTGGQTFAVPDAKCTLPNGTVCSDEALWNGTCPSYN